jgi:hypothetical protein
MRAYSGWGMVLGGQHRKAACSKNSGYYSIAFAEFVRAAFSGTHRATLLKFY